MEGRGDVGMMVMVIYNREQTYHKHILLGRCELFNRRIPEYLVADPL